METLNKKKYIKILLLALIVLVGIILRSMALLQNSSLRVDEACVLMNLDERTYLRLLDPLDMIQQIPPLLAMAYKYVYQVFNVNEIALRFIPYLSSVIALCLFPVLSNKLFKQYYTVLLSTLMFSLSPILIFQSQVLKPYSFDSLVSIIALLIVFNVDFAKISKKSTLGLALLASLGIWCSYPFFYTLAGICSVFFIKTVLEKNKNLLKNYLVFVGATIVNLCAYYFFHISKMLADPTLVVKKWYWGYAYGFFPNTYHEYNVVIVAYLFDGLKHNEPTSLALVVIVGLIFVLGLFSSLKNNLFRTSVLMAPVVFALLAGGLHLCPFAHRLLVFLLPMFILVMVEPLEHIGINKKIYSTIVLGLFIAYFSVSHVLPFCANVMTNKHSFAFNHIRDFHNSMWKKGLSDKEVIYVSAFEMPAFRCYNLDFVIPEDKIIYSDVNRHHEAIAAIPKGKDVYFYLYGFLQDPVEIEDAFAWMHKNCRKIEKTGINNECVKCYHK